MRTGLRVLLVAMAGLAASASPAAALDRTVGILAPFGVQNCAPNFDHTAISASSYQVPGGNTANWTVTSWSTNANANPGRLTMKFFRPVGGTTYQAVAHDGPRTLTPSSLNTFSSNVPGVKPGDVLGLHNLDNNVGCTFSGGPFDQDLRFNGDLADGQSAAFSTIANTLVNIQATLTPTNTFTQGATTLSKKRGTATIPFDLPNPGTVTATGNSVSVVINGQRELVATDRNPMAQTSASVSSPGVALVEFKALAKKKKKLQSKGKATVTPTVTYTPFNGNPKSVTLSVQLKLKKKK
jgi:hypothetical protein